MELLALTILGLSALALTANAKRPKMKPILVPSKEKRPNKKRHSK